ncbi:GNAT family N-acetyltransferase [Nisaea sp.]|uniref:GNAT family N-acetyltransferase n=1 Tax=Nisaea sp. TaxID=2024842 RepID=UPI003299719E
MASQVKQAFDTSILGGPVYRLEITSESELSDIRALVPDDAILVSVRLPVAWSKPAEESGFREIETLVQLKRDFAEDDRQPSASNIRPSNPKDGDFCSVIAEAVFHSDRYHADPMVSEKVASRVKAAWAQNEVNGRTDKTFIWEESGGIAGFNGCLLQNRIMTVDLIAVSQAHQGRGIGAALIKAAFSHYAGLADCALIATQDSNTGALALYRKLGFVETARFRTFHYVPAPIGLH